MKKLILLNNGLNAFKFQFDDHLLDEIRNSYRSKLQCFLADPRYQYLFEGGRRFDLPIEPSSNEYYLSSYGTNPLLWFSCNTFETYNIYKRFFDALEIESEVKELVDYDDKIVMYCGFLVIGNRAPNHIWHVDYDPNANAYTLITPLFDLDSDQGNLLYRSTDDQTVPYQYALGEAIIFGDKFIHSTEPYSHSKNIRVLLSLTFGTDKLQYWPILKNTLASQSKFLMLPCGHPYGSCRCLNPAGIASRPVVSKYV